MLNAIVNYVRGNSADAESAHPTAVVPPQPEVIISDYADDPDIGTILDEFVQGLPAQIQDMRRALSVGDFATLQRGAHRMKGAGGGYGYQVLTDAAKALEDAAKACNAQACPAELQRVAALCDGIRRGRNL